MQEGHIAFINLHNSGANHVAYLETLEDTARRNFGVNTVRIIEPIVREQDEDELPVLIPDDLPPPLENSETGSLHDVKDTEFVS